MSFPGISTSFPSTQTTLARGESLRDLGVTRFPLPQTVEIQGKTSGIAGKIIFPSGQMTFPGTSMSFPPG